MKKRIIILIFFVLAVINTITAGFWIFGIERKTELLIEKKENMEELKDSRYDISSLNLAISKLKGEIDDKKILYKMDRESNPLRMTEDVLLLLEKNRIKVINYRLEGEENKEELALTAEGKLGSILKLIYDLSYSQNCFRINFISVDAKPPGKLATIVIRITYA